MRHKEEILIQTETVKVRIMHLLPGETTPLHRHSEVTDNIFGLSGTMVIHLQDPDETFNLHPGRRCEILPGRRHMVNNLSPDQGATYLLIQGVGTYDFLTEDQAP